MPKKLGQELLIGFETALVESGMSGDVHDLSSTFNAPSGIAPTSPSLGISHTR